MTSRAAVTLKTDARETHNIGEVCVKSVHEVGFERCFVRRRPPRALLPLITVFIYRRYIGYVPAVGGACPVTHGCLLCVRPSVCIYVRQLFRQVVAEILSTR